MSIAAARSGHGLALGLVVASTVLVLMGTDLVLPAVPSLPETLGGDAAAAQLVLAAYVAGSAVGLLAFGALGDRFATRSLLIASLLLTSLASFACAVAPDIITLVALRAVQGAVIAAPAVFAAPIIRAMFDEAGAVRALGTLGSIESLTPALAPILGLWMLQLGGWQLSFEAIAAASLALAGAFAVVRRLPSAERRAGGSYARLVGDPVFLRYAFNQSFALGGLLVFVFGAPAVIVDALGGELADFIGMQIAGISIFIIASNLAGRLSTRFGAEAMIGLGTLLCAAGSLAILGYALAGGRDIVIVTLLFIPMNGGMGLRGPPGFFRAVRAARGDDARGAALVILGIFGTTSLGTAAVAPFIDEGLVPLAIAAAVIEVGALMCLLLPKLAEPPR